MTFYIICAIVTVVVLGLFVLYANGSERAYNQGYADAVEDYRQQIQNAMWQQYFNQVQGGDDEEENDE